MGDYTLQLHQTLIVGMSGSGKTTFSIRYALNAPEITCRFFFDDLGRYATRLKLRPSRTANELEGALASRWVIFNPHAMFPGDVKTAFDFFCQWVYDTAKRGPGRKLFFASEIWQWVTPHFVPHPFALCALTGREENIEIVSETHLPHKVNAAITGQATELVCFRLDERLALESVISLGMTREDVLNLPLGKFVARNRLTGGKLSGTVF